MQWTPEHTQWAEQHFDISSTTRSPAHKVEAYRGHLQRSYQYAWANDDISALTASNLLKKYAEKYSGMLEGPNERALLCSYSESAMNGRKSESESWQEGIYPTNCAPDVISVSKAGMAAALPPTDVCASIGSSPGGGALSEPGYAGSGCGSHAPGTLHAGLPSQEYTAGYGGSYLHSSYSGQTPPALPSPLHSAGILQPPPAPPPPTLLPGYDAESPNLPGYSYPPAVYPPQTAVAPGYSPAAAPPPSAYLPAGIAAPTPLPPSALPGYTFQPHNHAAEAPLNGSTANSLKRKAFYMTGHGDMDSYGHFTYSQQRSSHSPMYRMPDSSVSDSNRANGFDRNAEASSLTFKSTKQPVSSDQQRKCNLHSSRALSPTSYGSAKGSASDLRSGESYGKFGSSIISEQSEEHRAHLPHSLAGADLANSSSHAAVEQLKNSEAGLVAMVTTEILQEGPPVDWSDVAGLDMAKASIKEEILWPILRPDMFSGLPTLPRSLLLFGPQGTGRTLLARCMAHQLGAVFLRLNSSALVTKWLGEGDKILQASFLVARCRQPAVIFISEVDLLLAAPQSDDSPVSRLQAELLLQLDAVLSSAADRVLVVCSTNRPEEIPEDVRRYFTKRLLIPLPDHSARHQIIGRALAPHSYRLTEKDTALLVQRTEGFPGLDVARLCEEAVLGCLHGVPGSDPSSLHPGQIRPVSYQDFDNVFCKFQPSISQKELDVYAEWNKAFGCGQ